MTKSTTRLRCLSGRSCWLARPRPRSGCSGFRFPRLRGTMSRDCEVEESWNPEVTCHKLPVTWHKLRVTCHMSHVTVIIQWFTGSERATRAQRPGYWGFQFPRHKITKNCGVAERQTRFLWPQDNEPLGWKPKEVLKLILRNDSRRGVTKSWGLEKGLDKYLNNKLVIGDQDLNKYLNDWESRSRFQVSHYKVCLQILFLQNQINSYRKTASKNYYQDNK